jgi:hypothetical protein
MAKLSDLKVVIGLSKKGLTKLNADLRRTKANFRRNFGEIQGMVNGVGRSMTAGITAPLALMGAQSVKAFDQQAKAIAQVEAGLKSTAGQVGYTSKQLQQMASDLQAKTLFGDEVILKDATAQLLTFTNISGDQFARTQKAALDLATRLDGDLKGASIQLGKALNDPIANLSALSRSGIQFSAEQKEVIKSLTETGRLAEAQTIILDELEKQYGGSAEAAAKAGMGPFKQLQNTIGDLSEEFGKLIAEVLTPLIPKITAIVRSISGMSDGVKRSILAVAAVLGTAGPLAMAVAALMPLFAALMGPIGLVAAAVATLAYIIIKNFSLIEPAIIAVVNMVIMFQNKTKILGVVFTVLKTYLVGFFNFVVGGFKTLLDIVGSFGQAVQLAFQGEFAQAGEVVAGAFARAGEAAIEGGRQFGENLVEGMRDAVNAEDIALLEPGSISRLATGIVDDLNGFFSGGGAPAVAVPIEPMQKKGLAVGTAAAGGLMLSADQANATGHAVSSMNDMVAVSVDLAGQASNAFIGLGEALAGVATGTMNMGQFMASMLTNLADMLAQIGSQFIAAGVAAMNFYANLIANPPAAIAAGIALTVAAGLIKTLGGKLAAEPPKLAKGGLAYGPTLAVVGDNPGASANPEVIAPLDKLQQMMGGGNVTVTGRLDGRDILISSERAGFDRNRVRGF